MMITIANLNILYLSNLQPNSSVWIWIAFAMALIALFCSFAALRRSRQNPVPVQIDRPVVLAAPPAAGTLDPAIIAVLTAAVAMMLSDTTEIKTARPESGRKSPAGFTIRTIRRV